MFSNLAVSFWWPKEKGCIIHDVFWAKKQNRAWGNYDFCMWFGEKTFPWPFAEGVAGGRAKHCRNISVMKPVVVFAKPLDGSSDGR